MTREYVHYIPGGGLGDLCREAYYNGVLGILRRWKLRNPDTHLRVVLMTHNEAAGDLLVGHSWIDQVRVCPFVGAVANWAKCYDDYAHLFADRTELRFSLPERRSLYRVDIGAARKRVTTVENIPAVSMATDIALTSHEDSIVRFHAGRVVVHPFGGHTAKWFTRDILAAVHDAAGSEALVVGADYVRAGHESEGLFEPSVRMVAFPPRVLLGIVRAANAVVGSESSVYYMGAMWGVPVAMLWAPGCEFDLVRQGRSNWDWYYGEGERDNLFLPLPPAMTAGHRTQLLEWVREKAK